MGVGRRFMVRRLAADRDGGYELFEFALVSLVGRMASLARRIERRVAKSLAAVGPYSIERFVGCCQVTCVFWVNPMQLPSDSSSLASGT